MNDYNHSTNDCTLLLNNYTHWKQLLNEQLDTSATRGAHLEPIMNNIISDKKITYHYHRRKSKYHTLKLEHDNSNLFTHIITCTTVKDHIDNIESEYNGYVLDMPQTIVELPYPSAFTLHSTFIFQSLYLHSVLFMNRHKLVYIEYNLNSLPFIITHFLTIKICFLNINLYDQITHSFMQYA